MFFAIRKNRLCTIALGLIVLLLIIWVVMYLRHFNELAPYKSFSEPLDSAQIEPTFAKHIQPVLRQKCGACHTDTDERPFFYHIPLVNLWSGPYVENEIRLAREQFEFSKGLPLDRLGSTMELIIGLRQVIQDGEMPPIEYHTVRPDQKINTSEKAMILSWTEQATLTLNRKLFAETTEDAALQPLSKEEFGRKLARSLFAACPMTDPDDKQAHQQAIDRLTNDSFLKARMNVSFLWGGQKTPGNFNTYDSHLTRFNPMAWRKFYLSLFMFKGTYEVVPNGDVTAYLFPVRFRGELGDGEYPYPFWHSAGKWRKYNEAKYLIILATDSKIIASMRSADKQETVPSYASRTWNGLFRWFNESNQVQQPRVNNFRHVFSSSNPHVDRLENVYQQLALGFRAENCMACHSPDNDARMKMLEILSSPSHTLAAKDRLPIILRANLMPPPGGISDHEVKKTLIDLAWKFQKVANLALEYEDELVIDNMAFQAVE